MKAMIVMSMIVMAVGAARAQVQVLNEVWVFDAWPTGAVTLHNCGSAANLGDYSIANGDTVFVLPEVVLQEGERYVVLIQADLPVQLMSSGGLVDQIPALAYRWRARQVRLWVVTFRAFSIRSRMNLAMQAGGLMVATRLAPAQVRK